MKYSGNKAGTMVERSVHEMDTTKFDDVFLGILQHCEQVEPFLDAIFSFLSRKTDFFRVMHSRDDKMGFPPGVAEKIVKRVRQLVHSK